MKIDVNRRLRLRESTSFTSKATASAKPQAADRSNCLVGLKESCRMDIAVVLPIYNERENLRPLLAEIESALVPTSRSFEVIAIDDGSVDGSAEVLHDLATEKPYLKAIFFRSEERRVGKECR